jgi:hypothetical protein
LEAGDVGTVVHVHGDGAAFEIESFALTGDTLAVVTATSAQVRPVTSRVACAAAQRTVTAFP